MVLALALIPLALSMHIDAVGKALMVGSVLLVLIVELINSAIEALTDRVSLEKHVLAKRAKDLGSAAVMLSMINAVVIWMLVLFGGAWNNAALSDAGALFFERVADFAQQHDFFGGRRRRARPPAGD